jgi:NitT/TauT family transport system substrate-binding protein
MQTFQSRRRFLTHLSLAGAAGLVWARGSVTAEDLAGTGGEPPPETATIRLPAIPAACTAPLYLAEELLHEEGFAEVHYVPTTFISVGMLADGDLDISVEPSLDYLPLLDVGRRLTVLAGVHVGCLELRANDSIQNISDLRGKRVGISAIGAAEHLLVSTMAAYVGLDPVAQISWVVDRTVSQAERFTAGEIDAFIGPPPDPGQPCARNVGHVVVSTAADPPWSNYFCCMVTANADFLRNNPVATKRAMRAILRATDVCHEQPERAAQRMVDHGFSYECALMILNGARYGLWRDYDPEDTVRFFALRLHEAGMITSEPNKIIADGTDWRFLDELKRELKT